MHAVLAAAVPSVLVVVSSSPSPMCSARFSTRATRALCCCVAKYASRAVRGSAGTCAAGRPPLPSVAPAADPAALRRALSCLACRAFCNRCWCPSCRSRRAAVTASARRSAAGSITVNAGVGRGVAGVASPVRRRAARQERSETGGGCGAGRRERGRSKRGGKEQWYGGDSARIYPLISHTSLRLDAVRFPCCLVPPHLFV